MKTLENARLMRILLVEDNESDVFLTRRAFQKSKICNHIDVATDGEMAINFLKREGDYNDVQIPDIIFLDINLPKKDGKQVLSEIKNDPALKVIPVIVLTSSEAETDILKSYQLHASAYIMKPLNLEKFHSIVCAIEDFWFSIVVLP